MIRPYPLPPKFHADEAVMAQRWAETDAEIAEWMRTEYRFVRRMIIGIGICATITVPLILWTLLQIATKL